MFSEVEQKVYEALNLLAIQYTRYEHPPVYTVEEANRYWPNMKGAHAKNLFLRNNKGNRHYLVVLEQAKRADLGQLSEKLDEGKLSFASERRLMEHLGLEPGAVSPFGLINDQHKAVTLVVDRDLIKEEIVNFHPNVNTATIGISFHDFERYLEHCGNEVIII
ncbi:MAG TPA: prolyl-tRNA synthetase associated domain-containing protein [Candidatus Limnocylindrales bacterium]|nr:prolyl-tRNA synthetase associated domain-containing protein [Candidatus Limnocylindrales bacterium]